MTKQTYEPAPLAERLARLKANPHPLGQLYWKALEVRSAVPIDSEIFAALQLVVEALDVARYFDLSESCGADDLSRDELVGCVARARQALLGHGRVDKQGRFGISPQDQGIVILKGVESLRALVAAGTLSLETAVEHLANDLAWMLGAKVSEDSLRHALEGANACDCDLIAEEMDLKINFDRLRIKR